MRRRCQTQKLVLCAVVSEARIPRLQSWEVQALTLKFCVNPLEKQNMSVVEKKILKIMQEKYPTIFNNEKLADIFNVKFVEIEDIEPTTKSAKHGQVLDNTN